MESLSDHTRELLPNLVISPSIDFVSVLVPDVRPLPFKKHRFQYRAPVPEGTAGRLLTVHDIEPEDLTSLQGVYGIEPKLFEVEVSLDFRLKDRSRRITETEWKKDLHGIFARFLAPNTARAPFLAHAKARAFNPRASKVWGMQYRTPELEEQLLLGWRSSAAQLKTYHKVRDQRRPVAPDLQSVRVEVALREQALGALGLVTLDDLRHFQFRRTLTPCFRLVEGAEARTPRKTRHAARDLAMQRQREEDGFHVKQAWNKGGVQRVIDKNPRFTAAKEWNQRIGKALARLDLDFRQK